MSKMVLIIALLLMTSFLSYASQVEVIMLGRIIELDVLALLITMINVVATALALILIRIKHPPAPPYAVVLLFRQVRIALGMSININEIDEDYEITNTLRVEVGNLLPLELWI